MNILKRIAFGLMGLGFIFSVPLDTASAEFLFDQSSEQIFEDNEFFAGSALRDYTEPLDLEIDERGNRGEYQFRNIVFRMIRFLKRILVPISVILVVIMGAQLVLRGGNENVLKEKKAELTGIFAGFIIIILSVTVVDTIFFGQKGEIFREGIEGGGPERFGASLWDQAIGFYSYFSTFLVAIGIIFLIISAIRLIASTGGEEAIGNMRKRVFSILGGVFGLFIIRQVLEIFSRRATTVPMNTPDGVEEFDVNALEIPIVGDLINWAGGWLNFILGTIGAVGIIALVWAGIRLIMHFGDDEATAQSRRIISGVIIGLIIAFSAYTIIRFIIGAL